MRDLQAVLDASERFLRRGEESVLATVVKVEGSSYRRPGARLLIGLRGEWFGGVSGGCLESDLIRKAWWRTENGPSIVKYDSLSEDASGRKFGAGCNGVVHVLLTRIAPDLPDPLSFVRICREQDAEGVLATVIAANGDVGASLGQRFQFSGEIERESASSASSLEQKLRPAVDHCRNLRRACTSVVNFACGSIEASLEFIEPPIRLVVFGTGFDATPLVAAAQALGWNVVVVGRRQPVSSLLPLAPWIVQKSPREACGELRLTKRTAAVVMNHSLSEDGEALAALIESEVGYIGLLGPRSRAERLFAEMRGSSIREDERVHSPIGLDVGAEAPEEIAAAVVAEILAVFRGRNGGTLTGRDGPIHLRAPTALEYSA